MSRKGLMEQDLSKLDVTKLTPLSPEVISRQATINIGTIGHVAHGKSTVVKAISGVQSVETKGKFAARATQSYTCLSVFGATPLLKILLRAYGSGKGDSPLCDVPGFENCRMKLLRHVSFVDCLVRILMPFKLFMGAVTFASTEEAVAMAEFFKIISFLYGTIIVALNYFKDHMLKKENAMKNVGLGKARKRAMIFSWLPCLMELQSWNGALLLIAANESCPQPQTSEHFAAVEIMRLQHIIILQNKVDLNQENVAINQHEAIKKFIQGTVADGAPVVLISAQLKYNIDVVCEYIVKKIPIPERNFVQPPNMIVIRSFDVNKPGYEVDEKRGGVAGGSILRVCKSNDEVRPGIVVKDENGHIKCTPTYSRNFFFFFAKQHTQELFHSMLSKNELQFAVPGGLNRCLRPPWTPVNFFLLRRLLGVRTKGSERQGKVSKLAKGEILMLNIGSMSTGARVVAVKNDLAKLQLTSPVCTSKGEKIALSCRVEKHWHLIGWGQIQAGMTLDIPPTPILIYKL
ncbi:hypothetical protein NL676_029991 [Syzygium grande]|nr:hypothetical protein NL676_029991 [Syzygium grande]